MGQRLNIEIHDKDGCLCNCYYHWSAYTEVAFELLLRIKKEYIYWANDENDVVKAVKLLLATGAGIPDEELRLLPKYFRDNIKENSLDRNCGLIGISKKAQDTTRAWEENRITINLEEKYIDFDVFYLLDEEDIDEDTTYRNMDFNFHKIPLESTEALIEAHEEIQKIYKNEEDNVITITPLGEKIVGIW